LTRPAAFLDRDGTINARPPEHEYVTRIEEFQLLPGAIEGLARLANCGFTLVVVSNQRGIARGLVSEELLRATEDAIQGGLQPQGASIAGFYYCPHELDENCDCRKPKPGLLLTAASELDLDLGSSWMIGDSDTDIEAGRAAGCRTVLLGEGSSAEATLEAASLRDAAEAVCASGQDSADASNSVTRAR
jgi:D-glycero-D-manno-heptose 1,7-bisphosphate phosphatase